MKLPVACTIAAAVASLTLAAGEKKPASAKPDKLAEAGAAVNRLKQDERTKDFIKKADAAYEKAVKDNDAATAEIERYRKSGSLPKKETGKVTLEQLKKSLEENNLKEFNALLKESSEPLKREFEAWQEERKRRGQPAQPAPATDPPPVSFDKVPAPAPPPLLKAPEFPAGPSIKSEQAFYGLTNDPRNPGVALPESDLRKRMVLLRGDVRVRKPLIVLDADEADVILTNGQAGLFGGGRAERTEAAAVDPVVHEGSVQDAAFERIVARGQVRVMFVDANGTIKIGRGGVMIYDAKTGILLIKDWPEAEFGDTLLRGPSKDSVIELSNLKAEKPDAYVKGFEVFEVQRKLTADMPRTPEKEVPAAGPVKPRRSSGNAPASR